MESDLAVSFRRKLKSHI